MFLKLPFAVSFSVLYIYIYIYSSKSLDFDSFLTTAACRRNIEIVLHPATLSYI